MPMLVGLVVTLVVAVVVLSVFSGGAEHVEPGATPLGDLLDP
jgi:hypothetical protein